MMIRPRVLLVPFLSELEWTIRPQLEEWADVASYNAPGVGDEPAVASLSWEGLAERASIEVDRQGWDSCIVCADGVQNSVAVRLVESRPEAVDALVLGHARLSNSTEGERPAINGEVLAAFDQLVQQDHSAFIRHGLVQVTHGSIGDELAERMLEIVPPELAAQAWELAYQPDDMAAQLRSIDRPVLLAEHAGCLVMTPEGFRDAVAAFPRAQTVSAADSPSVSEEFAEALRKFCLNVVAADA
jgi:hypothetical protein